MLAKRKNYLHRCLHLHGKVTEIRYGKRQDLGKVESLVMCMWAARAPMWEIVEAIHDHDAFDANMFGSFDQDVLKSAIDQTQWRDLAKQELIACLFEAFRQIEPASVVLRFIDPMRFGIISSPVQTVLGIRPLRRPTATYEAYLESLTDIREDRRFERAADVEMALWVLQVGVLDGLLPMPLRAGLAKDHEEDAELRRIQARNLTKQLFETAKLDVADALLTTVPAIAGQIAGVEFEQLVVAASLASGGDSHQKLRQHINSLGTPYRHLRRELHQVANIRNDAIHDPESTTPADVEYLIAVARKLQSVIERCA